MSAAGLKLRPSLRPWPGPSFWTWVRPGEARVVTLATGATGVFGQMNMARLESSYQALPSSSIAL
ncbi:hypothetical protein Pyn_36328 [Prunus yedoensis var. nudiflora]|uniref:Uncharacterized protein n=1 Tax=Prunus yedoensis var. nudiflora TaxID=2094558 RepID=A0A314YHW4_PRUYE|nr:hypothetical protein Pyn_36328 [Prunus yedoensis var. nudiflora]